MIAGIPITTNGLIPTSNGAQSGGSGAGFATGTYQLATGLSTDHLPQMENFDRQLYVTNGWDAVKVWDGVSALANDAGVAAAPQDWAPVPVQVAGDVAVGVHLVRYRYKSSRTGYVSDPSNPYELTVASSSKKVTFLIDDAGVLNIVRTTDSKMDQIVVEMTTVAGSTYFVAETVDMTATTVDVDIDDDALAEFVLDWADDGHVAPPPTGLLISHKGRMFMLGAVVHSSGTCSVTNGSANVTLSTASLTDTAIGKYFAVDGDTVSYLIDSKSNASQFVLDENYAGATDAAASYSIYALDPNILYWSQPNRPESFDPDSWTPVLKERGDTWAGIAIYGGDLMIFGGHAIERLSFTDDPSDGALFPCSDERGAINQQCLVKSQNQIYGMDRLGFYRWACPFPIPIGDPIDEMVPDINWDQAAKFNGVYSPEEKVIRWYYCTGSDTEPQNYFEYGLVDNTWSTGRIGFGVRSSVPVQTAITRRVLFGDIYGYTWYADIGTVDGADPSNTVKGTVGAGSTDTIINIDEAGMDTAGDGLDGVEAYWVEGDESQIIDSNTAAAITLKSAFTGAPTVGDTIYIGRTAATLKTKAIPLGPFKNRQENMYAHLFFVPTTETRTLIMRLFKNYGATGKDDYATRDERGIATTLNSEDIEVDLSDATGHARISLGTDSPRVVEIELIINEPDTALRLTGLVIGGETVEAED